MGDALAFPFEISDIFVDEINGDPYRLPYTQIDDSRVRVFQNDNSEFIIESLVEEKIELTGSMIINTKTFSFIPNISIASNKYSENGDELD